MTCKHDPGDPACSSAEDDIRRLRVELAAAEARYAGRDPRVAAAAVRDQPVRNQPATPNNAEYTITQFQRVGSHVVLKVLYPNCAKCAYEGHKVMVFADVPEAALLKWRKIDPHFRDPAEVVSEDTAPSPVGRFPASPWGWETAVRFAGSMRGGV